MSIAESFALRPDLEPLPSRLSGLPLDERGYPVPWFVAWIDGKPEFRAMDGAKLRIAIRERRCWVCGEPMGRWMTFILGPMCCINLNNAEPPSHLECAQWSARNCPFLNGRKQKRREDDLINNGNTQANSAGFAITRQPNAIALWKCRDYALHSDGRGGILFRPGEPVGGIEWYSGGRAATRAEIEESVRTGLPILQDAARSEGAEAELMLAAAVEQFWLLPLPGAASAAAPVAAKEKTNAKA